MQISSFLDIATQFKVIFFDSYGVLKNYKGLINGVGETLGQQQGQNILIRILTNDASRSPQRQVEKFHKLGLKSIQAADIVTSGMMAKRFLESKVTEGKVAYLGTPASAQYIIDAKLEAVHISRVDLEQLEDIVAFVFLDDEGFDWNFDINTAVNLLRRKNIPVIVANSDRLYPVAKNDVSIATGGIAQLVESILNRKFIHFGKPDSQMFMYAFEQINRLATFQKQDILMVGDTLHTDILGGNKFGIQTALVLTGNTQEQRAEVLIRASGIIPDYICRSIVE
ncbi:MAG: HAD-IIA family hydrolase [Bacteroidota bacterium]